MARVGRIKLGSQGLEVSAQGLRCMGMSAFYGAPKPKPDMITLIHHTVQSGVTFLDTSDIYGPHTNEILLEKALKGGVREQVELATKFRIIFADGKREIRGGPAYVRVACEASLKRLEEGKLGAVKMKGVLGANCKVVQRLGRRECCRMCVRVFSPGDRRIRG